MKAILEFDLPEEESEHLRAVTASHAWAALAEIRLFIRNHIKHGNPESAGTIIEQIRHVVIEAETWIGE